MMGTGNGIAEGNALYCTVPPHNDTMYILHRTAQRSDKLLENTYIPPFATIISGLATYSLGLTLGRFPLERLSWRVCCSNLRGC